MPLDWTLGDSAIRRSVLCLLENDVPHEKSFSRLEKDLVKFPMGAKGTFTSFELEITSVLPMKVL
jgi:hypothetical protein